MNPPDLGFPSQAQVSACGEDETSFCCAKMETAAASEALRGKSEGKGDGKMASSSLKNMSLTEVVVQRGRQLKVLKQLRRIEAEEDEACRKMEALLLVGKKEENEALGPFVGKEESLLEEFMEWPDLNILEIRKAEDEEATKEALRMMFEDEEEKEAREEAEMMGSDYEAYKASFFRDDWIAVWSRTHGSFEDTTKLGPMRYTDVPAPHYGAFPMCSLQVFSVKVEGIRGGLQWPLDVFGIVAVRDTIDFNRNIIFSRTRDNCQTLTKENRNLALEGPTRAVLWMDYLNIEVKLTVKGATQCEDKDLSFLVVPFVCGHATYSRQICRYKTSKLSTLRLTLGHIVRSVEATIFVRVSDGSWPGDFRAQFAAFTTGIRRKGVAGVDHKKIILLDSGSGKVPVTGEGEIMLSRRVVSVETTGKLRVCVKAWEGLESVNKNAVKDQVFFTPKEASRSSGLLDAGFCKMEVTVAWSLIYCHG
ncbi:unnamed protein product [Urochloa humidicola]